MNLPVIPQDKANHFVYGAAIAVVVGAVVGYAGYNSRLVIAVSIGASVLFGAAKEAADWYRNRKAQAAGAVKMHGVEFADFLVTAAGGVAVNALLLLSK